MYGRICLIYVISDSAGAWDHASVLPKVVALVAFPGFQSLDLVGPLEVFDAARRIVKARSGATDAYRIVTVAPTTPVESSSGLSFVPHQTLDWPIERESRSKERATLAAPRVDTLIVAGGFGSRAACQDTNLVAWVRETANTARRVCSVCTGAFVLAAAGLLGGRRAATHWSAARELAEKFPAVSVDAESIFVRDGHVWTSAGVTAGMDLSLALVEEDFGSEVALTVARYLVLFVRRPGGQSQFSAQLGAQSAERRPLRELQTWIVEHPEEDLRVPRLAERVGMSVRNFARAFRNEIGMTPAEYVEATRLEVARRLLETTNLGIDGVASAAGFGTTETLRRAFVRRLHTNPGDYRRRFQPSSLEEQAHGHRNTRIRPHHRVGRRRTLRSPESSSRSSRSPRRQA